MELKSSGRAHSEEEEEERYREHLQKHPSRTIQAAYLRSAVFFSSSLRSFSPQLNTQRLRGAERRWDEKQITDAQPSSAPTMAPATLVGKLAESASQERAAVLGEKSAALHRV